MFGNSNPWTPYQPQPYRPQLYGQQAYPVQQNMPMQDQFMQQPGMINARYVTGREEAVAAQILPDGNPYLFKCAAQGRIFEKCVNPQTGMAEFSEYTKSPPQQEQQPIQFAPIDAMQALVGRVEQLEQAIAMMKEANS